MVGKASSRLTCPVAATCMKNFLQVRPKFSGPFFLSFFRHYKTHYQSILILKNILKTCNYDDTNFKSHSFRIHIGTIISSARQGTEKQMI